MTPKKSQNFEEGGLKLTDSQVLTLSGVIRRAVEEQNEIYKEVWLSEKELCKTFATLKPSWLEKYRSSLHALGCARQPCVKDELGSEHKTGWTYARNKIQRLFATGEIEHLQCRAVIS